MGKDIRVTVWNENVHEREHEAVQKIYPEGIHGAIANHLNKQDGIVARIATLDQPEHGLTQEVCDETDVMTWWGHMAHEEVDDAIVERVQKRVHEGMGLIVLHSGHYAKILRRLLGTSCCLKWREEGEKERLWNVNPSHPITEGIGEYFELQHTEMYGEPYGIPNPDELIFISWFQGGEVFRSGCTWQRGHGKVFYFRPGHETLPIYRDENVLRVITNAVRWGAAKVRIQDSCPNVKALEKLG